MTMNISEKLKAIKTLTVGTDNHTESAVITVANHITEEVITDIKKKINDLSIRVSDIKGACQIRLPKKYGKEIVNLAIKELGNEGYYAEYTILDNFGGYFCFYITASVMRKLKNKPDKDKNKIVIKDARAIRKVLVKTAVLDRIKNVVNLFDYGLKQTLADNKTNETITLTEENVRLINKYIAADIEDYLDTAMSTIKDFCDENGITITNIKKWGDDLIFADLTISV